jgi:hypothetical protein
MASIILLFVTTICVTSVSSSFTPLDALRPAVTVDEQRSAVNELLSRVLPSSNITTQFEINIDTSDHLMPGSVIVQRSANGKLSINANSAVDAAYGIQVGVVSEVDELGQAGIVRDESLVEFTSIVERSSLTENSIDK